MVEFIHNQEGLPKLKYFSFVQEELTDSNVLFLHLISEFDEGLELFIYHEEGVEVVFITGECIAQGYLEDELLHVEIKHTPISIVLLPCTQFQHLSLLCFLAGYLQPDSSIQVVPDNDEGHQQVSTHEHLLIL